jgi:hypothetical protein
VASYYGPKHLYEDLFKQADLSKIGVAVSLQIIKTALRATY